MCESVCMCVRMCVREKGEGDRRRVEARSLFLNLGIETERGRRGFEGVGRSAAS